MRERMKSLRFHSVRDRLEERFSMSCNDKINANLDSLSIYEPTSHHFILKGFSESIP